MREYLSKIFSAKYPYPNKSWGYKINNYRSRIDPTTPDLFADLMEWITYEANQSNIGSSVDKTKESGQLLNLQVYNVAYKVGRIALSYKQQQYHR